MSKWQRELASRVSAIELVVVGLIAERAVSEPNPKHFLRTNREALKAMADTSPGSDSDERGEVAALTVHAVDDLFDWAIRRLTD